MPVQLSHVMPLLGNSEHDGQDTQGSSDAVLRRAVDMGVDHIDTSQYYGPDVANELIREALYPYPDTLALVSKVGVRRDESGGWLPDDEPDQLRRFDDQLAAMIQARDEGLIGGVGLSNVTLEHLLRALEHTQVVCVQVLSNEHVLSTAERLGITPAQVALAWTSGLAPNILLIPGTSSVRHLEDNLAVADIELDKDTQQQLTAIAG